MPTEKLYWADPFATTFQTEGARAGVLGGKPSIVLERTLFYPEAGGQLPDLGTLAVEGHLFAVDDVQIDDAGDIHHLVGRADPAPILGKFLVTGTIDRERRRDHMAQHTAQHALSRALEDVAHATTVSARLGARACTLDLHVETVSDGDLARAEDAVNAIILDDVPVRALFPSEAELLAMDLRRSPKVTTNVRVIDIEGFDLSPCGGTHCTRSGQIGVVRIAGTERVRGKLRVVFHAARRAVADARAKERVLSELAAELTCGLLDVGAAVSKLRADLKGQREALSTARGELVELVCARVLGEHPPDPSGTTRITLVRPSDDLGMLRALAGRLAARPDVVAICASPTPNDTGPAGMMVVAQRGAGATFDCGVWLKTTAEAHGSRGGGRPERAEGRLPPGTEFAL
jgi:alanyl-tRNA synthetase